METSGRSKRIQRIITQLLVEIGEDPNREGLRETPARVARFWTEFMEYDPGKTGTVFENGDLSGNGIDQMVVVGPMRVWSLCEHHLLPFSADVIVGYMPQGKILGLSKFARIAHKHAHGLQVQERLVQKIAHEVAETVDSQDVAVVAYGDHLCMTMRGIKTPSKTVSSVMMGGFRDNVSSRKEFFDIAANLRSIT